MRAKMPSPERSPWPGVRRHPDDHFSTLGQAPERGRGTPLGYGLIITSALPTQQTSEILSPLLRRYVHPRDRRLPAPRQKITSGEFAGSIAASGRPARDKKVSRILRTLMALWPIRVITARRCPRSSDGVLSSEGGCLIRRERILEDALNRPL